MGAFEYKIIDRVENDDKECLINQLNALETYYIKKYDTMNNGYNMTEGGYNGLLSDETKHKISESLKGHKISLNFVLLATLIQKKQRKELVN